MKKLKIGIFGANRGSDNYESIMVNNVEIVAVCDKKQYLLDEAAKKLGNVALYTDFDKFIEHDMDAVYIANYFNEHAPYAIKALERNINVISECTAAGTLAECVALVRAAEKSSAIYMIAENYPYMLFNQEMRKIYQGGTLGKILFAEGEYNHPTDPSDTSFISRYYDSEKHWRNFNPASYYITHSLGPLMMATHSNPIRVTAMPIYGPKSEDYASSSYVGDNSAIITCLNDDDSVYRVTGCAKFGGHENSYRLACEKGQIENVRGTDGKVMLRYNYWEVPEGKKTNEFYNPSENPADAEVANRAGHGGGDYYMFKDFFNCIRTGTKPYLDVYVATRMACVGILAHRSLLKLGEPYDIPDFRKEEDKVKYENDRLTPFWGPNGEEPSLSCCSRPDYRPSERMVERFKKAASVEWRPQ